MGNRRLRRLACGAVFLVVTFAACGATKDVANDPLGDATEHHGFGTNFTDEVWDQTAPSVGWLSDPYGKDEDSAGGAAEKAMLARERAAAGAGEIVEAERRSDGHDRGLDDEDDGSGAPEEHKQKSFGEKAEEATMATMSVLIGAGMMALPYLLGT